MATGVAKSRIKRPQESLVLYKSVNTLWRKPFHTYDFPPGSFLPHFSFFNSAEKITPAVLVFFKTDLKSKRRGYKNIDRCNGASVFCFLSCFYPFSPHPPRQFFGPTCHLSIILTNTVSPVRPTLFI